MMTVRTFTVCAPIMIALLTTPAFAQSTEEVLQHHLEAFGSGDVDAIMSDYAEDAVLINPHGVAKGHDEIRRLFEGLTAEFGKPGMSIEMLDQKIEGDVAYIIWTAETADNVYEFATDTLVVRDGKIDTQTFAAKIEPK